MGSVIDYLKIESQAYSNIFQVIDNRANIVDPKRKDMIDAQKRTFVYDYDPLDTAINFDDFPYIFLELPIVTDEEDSHSLDGTKKDLIWTQRIVVRTKKQTSSNVDTDPGRTDMLNICDDLHQTFNNSSVKATLYGYNIKKIILSKIRYEAYALNNSNDVHESEFELKYKTRIKVVA